MNNNINFYGDFSIVETRAAYSARLRENHPNKVPVIVERSATEKYLPMIRRKKYLVVNDMSIMQLIWMFR